MPEINPRQIAFARTRRCYKKARLAEALGVSIQTLQSYEAGTSAPDDAMLSRIALLLNFPRSFFFLEEDMPVISEHAASFRALSKMSATTQACALSAGANAFRLNEWMDARFKLPQAALPDLSDLSPEDAALTLRVQWGLGHAPIRNMIHLLESKGVRVFSLTEESRDVDAFCSWYEGTPFVFLNTMKSAERSRFDAAHELGHLVRDTYSMLHRDETGERRHDEIEQQANAFAAAFLMPKDAVIARKPAAFTVPQLIRIKRYWGVSLVALARRYSDLGQVSEWIYRNLCVSMSRNGYRSTEPEPMARETSQLLSKVMAHLQDQKIGRSQIARDLCVSVDEINALTFNLTPLSVVSGSGSPPTAPGQPPQLRLAT